MPTVIEGILPAVLAARGKAGEIGIRLYRIFRVVKFSGSSPRSELGEEETEIVEGAGYPPKIEWASDEEIALGGLPVGTVKAGPITPETTGGGTAPAFLRGDDVAQGDRLYYRIRGPKVPGGALFRVHGFTFKATGTRMLLAPVELENNPDD